MDDNRRLVSFYAKGGRTRKPKLSTEVNTMPQPMAPAPGAPVSMSADGPAMKKGGKTMAKRRGGKIKVTIKEKKLAMGGNPMEGRMTTGVVGRKPRTGMPVAGGGGASMTHGGGAQMRQPSAMQTVPSMMGALGRVR